jgi:hypothetical protein
MVMVLLSMHTATDLGSFSIQDTCYQLNILIAMIIFIILPVFLGTIKTQGGEPKRVNGPALLCNHPRWLVLRNNHIDGSLSICPAASVSRGSAGTKPFETRKTTSPISFFCTFFSFFQQASEMVDRKRTHQTRL